MIEPLLYKSRFYDRSAQSLMLSMATGDERPFVLSTPRLESDALFHLQAPFDDEVVDELFRLKSRPRTWPEIKEMLNAPARSESLVRSFLTPDPPPRYQPYVDRGVRSRSSV